jgi:uncharacterized membrane protein
MDDKSETAEVTETAEADESLGGGMGRMLTLSDGIFAIAITLLVLNLGVDSSKPLGVALGSLIPRVWAAALSFAVIGRFWLIHRRMFTQIHRQDEMLLRLNLVFLAAIVAMPFATDLLTHPGQQPIQVMTYAATIGAAALLSAILWAYACVGGRLVDQRLMESPEGTAAVASGLRGLPAVAVCLVSVIVAAASPGAGEFVWIAFAVPGRWAVPWLRWVAARLISVRQRLAPS